MKIPRSLSRPVIGTLTLLSLAVSAGCGSAAATPAPHAASSTAATGTAGTLRLGYLANLTHATALYGVASGGFQQALGSTQLKTSSFSAGPAAVEALRGGGLDAAFLGPNSAVNGFTQTHGKLLRIVAGTTSGGASLVVRSSITSVAQLAGRKIATPQLGNTQDVAAKTYFQQQGVQVKIVNQDNAQTLDLFKSGQIDGGWVPEPWASRLVVDGGGKVLVDEASQWPAGRFSTTELVVRTSFLQQYPATVQSLLKGLIAANTAVVAKSATVQEVVNGQLKKDTGKALSAAVLGTAFAQLTPTLDPIAASLARSAHNAEQLGLLHPVNLHGIYDLTLLNALLAAAGQPAVSDGGLGSS